MPWCPICKNEYREGIKLCAECQVELVDRLEDEKEQNVDFEEEMRLARLQAMYTAHSDEREEDSAEEIPTYHAYQHSAVKAEDNRTSAHALLFVGVVGFILDLLIFTDVIPVLHTSGTSRYFVCGVMGAMFVLFVVFGVVSMRNSKILFVQAQSEDTLISELTKWCESNLNAEEIDRDLFEEEMSEEQKYFKRTDRMKEIISDKFMNLDQALLEHFVDEYYQGLFEVS